MIYTCKKTQGFTLVETLVAIAILTIAMVGPFYAVEQSLTASNIARDQLVASSLAQEGVEYARGVRDANYLYNYSHVTPHGWLLGLDGSGGKADCTSGYGCSLDATPTGRGLLECTSNSPCPPLKLSSSYFYNLQSGGGNTTLFTRSVKVVSLVADKEAQVVVTVSWKNHGKDYNVTVTDVLENWL